MAQGRAGVYKMEQSISMATFRGKNAIVNSIRIVNTYISL